MVLEVPNDLSLVASGYILLIYFCKLLIPCFPLVGEKVFKGYGFNHSLNNKSSSEQNTYIWSE